MNEGLLKKFEDRAQIIDYIIDPVILINKENLLINFFNYESEIFFSISREKIANKHINFLFGKSSSITDYIEYSLKKNGKSLQPIQIFLRNCKFVFPKVSTKKPFPLSKNLINSFSFPFQDNRYKSLEI